MPKTLAGDTFSKERRLFDAIAPLVRDELPGTDVLAVELLSPSRFCVYVDRPGGVDFALCEEVTRLLDEYRADWTIDVSSPGPERPLRTAEHFSGAVGSAVQVRTRAAIDGSKRFRGTVSGLEGLDVVLLEVDEENVRIPVGDVVRANLIDEGR